MADLEKVIKGLECCTADLMEYHQDHFCDMCPYKSTDQRITYCFNKRDLMADALSLLKAHEPIEPIELYDDTKCVEDYNRTLAWKCGKCGYYIGGADNFCANCGQAVKWDE